MLIIIIVSITINALIYFINHKNLKEFIIKSLNKILNMNKKLLFQIVSVAIQIKTLITNEI